MHPAFINVCRLCMAEGTECMQSIFTESEHDGEKFLISARISAVTSMKVQQGDQLPGQVCHDCIAQVNRWYDFKMMCEGSDTLLRQRLKELEADPSMVWFQVKAEPSEAMATLPAPLPAHISPVQPPSNHENVSYSLVQPDSGLGRMSHSFSLHQDVNAVSQGLVFNGDTSSLLQVDALPNGLSVPPPFLCVLCDARFTRKAQLKRHVAAHCGELPHSCSRCDAGFLQKADLIKHMRAHYLMPPQRRARRSQTYSFTCRQCLRSFRHPQALLHHQSMHTGVARQRCVFCQRICASNVQLLLHVQVKHVRCRRRRLCPRCRQAFSSFAVLLQHQCSGRATMNGDKSGTISGKMIASASNRTDFSTVRTPVNKSNKTTTGINSKSTVSLNNWTDLSASENSVNTTAARATGMTATDLNHKHPNEERISVEQSPKHEKTILRELKNNIKSDSKTNIEMKNDMSSESSTGNFSGNTTDRGSDQSSNDTSHPCNVHFVQCSADANSICIGDNPSSDQPVDNTPDISNDQFPSYSNDSGASRSNDHPSDHFTFVMGSLSEDLSDHGTEESLKTAKVPDSEQLPVLSEES